MNTIEAERLVRRIIATLKGEGDPAMAPKLAADFQTACASVALRLEQCRSMIDAGAFVQAIQLAETQPNLLDLVTVLEFRQADEWRQLCHSKNLPCPETLPARDVSALNNCYNRGISPQHPVYGAYREAVLVTRNDDQALQALKSIVRLNPSDANAASELARLDAKILGARLAKLEGLLASEPDAAIKEMEAIEAFGFKSELAGGIWQRAQLARSAKILIEAEHLKGEGLLAEIVAQLDFLAQLRTDHKLTWPPEWENRVGVLREWCRAEAEARRREEEYNAALEQVNQAILVSEAKETRAKRVSIHELKTDLEELHNGYRLVESFSRPMPGELTERFKECSALIRQRIKKLAVVRTVLSAAGVATVVLVLAVMALVWLGLHRANSLASELRNATNAHQVRTLQSLLKLASGKTILPTTNLKLAADAATAEVASQMALLTAFQTASRKLPANLTSVTEAKQLVETLDDLNRTEQAHAALSPDLQVETEPELTVFRQRWEGHCAGLWPAVNKGFDNRIATDESAASTLSDATDLNLFRSTIAEMLPRLEQVAQEIATLEPVIKVRPELANRCKALLERLRDDQNRLGKLDAAVGTLSQAGSTEELATTVADLAAIDLKQSEYVRAARKAGAVAALKNDPEALSRFLLLGTSAPAWESFSKAGNADLIPGKFTPDVRSRFMALTRDYAVNASHFRCRLYRDSQLKAFEEWITDGPLVTNTGWHSIPGWEVKDEGPCEFAMKECGVFQGQYQFSDRQPAYGVTVTDITALTDVWQGSGFAKLMDTRNLSYKLPPLKVVDAIFEAESASPIFKAYLLNELLGFMVAQPLESGLVFCPQLRKLSEQLDALSADRIKSGDWFVPARINAVQSKYAEFFAAHRSPSYFKQAVTFLNATTRAMKSGFALAGYVGPDGKPVWKSPPGDNLVWGLSESDSQPKLLLQLRGGAPQQLAKPLPLTPLLIFQGDLASIIKDAGVRPEDPSVKGQLPPLFAVTVSTP